MRSLARRVKSLEDKSQGGDYQETLSFLTLMHDIKHGPLSVVAKAELERQARELAVQGIYCSIAQILKEVDGKGLPRPNEKGGR
jgi:hypothetical protein